MSLLARLSAATDGGPVRPRPAAPRNSPYTRPPRTPKGDSDAQWSHDLYEDPDKPSLSARLSAAATAPRKPESVLAQRAIRDATASANEISIKGASNGNVVQVSGLVKGTTPADVEAIFRRCGHIISSELATSHASDNVTVRLTFKQALHAAAAVSKFDQQPADGRILHVSIVGVQSVGLSGRLGGVNLVNENGSVDVLMASSDDAASKMRSDSIMSSDPRATVLVAPPGADPKPYQRNGSRPEVQRWQRGGKRGGRRGGLAPRAAPTSDLD